MTMYDGYPGKPEVWERPLTPTQMREWLNRAFEGFKVGERRLHVGRRMDPANNRFSNRLEETQLVLFVPGEAAPPRPVLIKDEAWPDHPDETPKDVVHPALSGLLTLVRAGLRGSTTLRKAVTTPEGRAQRRPLVEDLIQAATLPRGTETQEEAVASFVERFQEFVLYPPRDGMTIDPDEIVLVTTDMVGASYELFDSLGAYVEQTPEE